MNRKRKIAIGVVSLVVAAIVAVAMIWALQASRKSTSDETLPDVTASQKQAESSEKTGDTPKGSSDESLTFTQANASMLEKAMESRDKNEQSKALIPALRGGSWKPNDVLPDGARIKIDRTSFKPSANGEATVDARVSGSVQAEFVLSLMFVKNEHWLISTTTRK